MPMVPDPSVEHEERDHNDIKLPSTRVLNRNLQIEYLFDT